MKTKETFEAKELLKVFRNGLDSLSEFELIGALDVAIEALEAQDAVVHMDLPKISEDDLKKMLTKMNHQQQLEWIVDGTIPNNFGKDANVPSNDTISRQDVIELVKNSYYDLAESIEDTWAMVADVEKLPSAQPESLSDAYMKTVWTWLLNYQIKAAELKGRYTPYEVLSWVVNDWRREHE